MEKIKKIFSCLLVLCVICLSLFAFNIKKMAVSAYSSPRYIYDADDLTTFAKNVNTGSGNGTYANCKAYLMNSINMENVDFQGIGNSAHWFTGIFYGQGNTIYNLSCSGEEDRGLFGYLSGQVKDLTISGGTITCKNDKSAGAFAGSIYNSAKITNCINLGCDVKGYINNNAYVGGIVGYINSSTATIEKCYSNAEVHATGYGEVRAGGIAGMCNNTSTIKECYVGGKVYAGDTNTSKSFAGGIVGESSANINNCLNTGSVLVDAKYDEDSSTINSMSGVGSDKKETGIFDYVEKDKPDGKDAKKETQSKYAYIGGIAGQQSGGTIQYCINTDSTNYSSQGGYNLYKYTLYYKLHNGIVGKSYDTYFYMYFTLRVNYYNALVGFQESGTLSNCYHPDKTSQNRSKVEVTYYEFEWGPIKGDTYLGEKSYSDSGDVSSKIWTTYDDSTSPQLGFIPKWSDAQIYTIYYESAAAGADSWHLYTMSCPGKGEQWVDSTKIQESTDMTTITSQDSTIWGYRGSSPIIKQFYWGNFAIEPGKAKCRECGHTYKDNIASCPNCEAPTV